MTLTPSGQENANWSFHKDDILNPKNRTTFLLTSTSDGKELIEAKHHTAGNRTIWINKINNQAIPPDSIVAICLTPHIIRREQAVAAEKLMSRIRKARSSHRPDPVTPEQIAAVKQMMTDIKERMKGWKPRENRIPRRRPAPLTTAETAQRRAALFAAMRTSTS